MNQLISSGHTRTIMSNQSLMQGIYDFGSFKQNVDPAYKELTYPEWKGFKPPKKLPKTPLPKGFTPIPI